MKRPLLIAIAGPTASGKTALAVALARKLNTEIISFDSRQIYKELVIGVAKPNKEELEAVPHHFISEISIHENYNAGRFEKDSLERIERLFKTYPVIIAVGGNGLYLQALLKGLDPMDSLIHSSEQQLVRDSVRNLFEIHGLEHVQKELLKLDPESGESIAMLNTARVLRALELVMLLKKPIAAIRAGRENTRSFNHLVFGIELERKTLYSRIDARVDAMLASGLESEARELLPFRNLNALKTVGYSEWFSVFEGKMTRDLAIVKIKQHTRNYAKRQLTWFNNTVKTKWLAEDQAIDAIFAEISEYV